MRAVVVQEPMMLILFSLVVTLAALIFVLVASRGAREPYYPYRYRYERPTYIRRSRVYEMEEPDDGTGVGCTLVPFVIGGVVTLIALAKLLS